MFLVALTLAGSIGINADFHICQDTVKNVAILDLADGCSEMETTLGCKMVNTSEATVEKQKCCSNEHIFAKASFEQVQSAEELQITAIALPGYFAPVSIELNETFVQTYFEKPPTWQVSSGLHIAFQQFLI